MKVQTIYLVEDTAFTKEIKAWAEEHGIPCDRYDKKIEDALDQVDGLVVFHENHNFEKADEEMMDDFNVHSREVHKIDINGTLSATVSHYNLWIERNKIQKVLILGDDDVAKNPNLHRYLTNLKEM